MISFIHTWSGARRHRTLLVQQARAEWTLFVWVHPFERPWRFRETGICCVGLGFLSFNFYSEAFYQ